MNAIELTNEQLERLIYALEWFIKYQWRYDVKPFEEILEILRGSVNEEVLEGL